MSIADACTTESPSKSSTILRAIQARYRSVQDVRKGICLLNAGRFEEAANAFQRAKDGGFVDHSLPSYLAACLLGKERFLEAAEQWSGISAAADSQTDETSAIRQALSLRLAGRMDEGIAVLRDAVRRNPDSAELHVQLGLLLVTTESYDEAELRFTQAVNLDRDHVEGFVNLALCCALRGAPRAALKYLQQAQSKRPFDARIGLLLAQAAKAVQHKGELVQLHAAMADESDLLDPKGVEELARVIEVEPDFVDAFLSIPSGEIHDQVFAVLLRTLQVALERQPEHAELHFHCGRVLARLGQPIEAIRQNEHAVRLNPTYTRALIELGRLYGQTDRADDATTRLEQAIAAGADYADVHYLLGNLYRDQGRVTRAATAYRRALALNEHYDAAREALASLATA